MSCHVISLHVTHATFISRLVLAGHVISCGIASRSVLSLRFAPWTPLRSTQLTHHSHNSYTHSTHTPITYSHTSRLLCSYRSLLLWLPAFRLPSDMHLNFRRGVLRSYWYYYYAVVTFPLSFLRIPRCSSPSRQLMKLAKGSDATEESNEPKDPDLRRPFKAPRGPSVAQDTLFDANGQGAKRKALTMESRTRESCAPSRSKSACSLRFSDFQPSKTI